MLLLDRQKDNCAICGILPKEELRADHNHQTGQVRGLLCNKCNLMLGLVGDSIPTLNQAVTYLEGDNVI